MIVLLAVATVVAACTDSSSGDDPPPTSPPADDLADWQDTVDELEALQRAQELPVHLQDPEARRDGSEFDVGAYFSVLEHLDLGPGFVLDYVYRFTSDRGFPVLYLRRAETPRFATVAQYRAATGAGAAQGDLDYLEQISVVDGLPEGFFEYAVLAVMGGQFYLFWHGIEDDETVVVTKARLDEDLERVADHMDAGELEKARAIDPTPHVAFDGDTVTVELVTFSVGRGVFRHRFVIERTSPHRILETTADRLAACDCEPAL